MDYEKKYKEAMELAKSFITPNRLGATKEELVKIFPELAESDDEKVMKWIINEIKYQYDIKNCPAAKKALAWLEKQGERNPVEWSEEDKGVLIEAISVLENNSHFVLANKLKSLRPQKQWKPTEEQMKALLSVLPTIKGSGTIVSNTLETLYDDLNALKDG